MRRSIQIAGLASLAMLLACAAIIGFEPGIAREEDAGVDVVEAGDEFSEDIGDPNKWSTFDLQSVIGVQSNGFGGGTFDGRYVYFAPIGNLDTLVRYDTTSVFGMTASWDKFGLTTLNMNAHGYYGAMMVSGKVVLTPYLSGLSAWYNTQKPFDAGYQLIQTGNPGYIGSVFDGRNVYFVPHYSVANMAPQGLALRYALEAGADASPWSSFDFPTKINMNASGYWGGVFDGRYVYYVPFNSPFTLRYDSTLSFTDPMSWKSFDLRTLRPDALNYTTAAFDGKYVYLVPRGSPTPHGLVVRFDVATAFDKPAGWSVFDTTQINPIAKGFGGSAFDGRFLYLAPAQNGLVVRYDTTKVFGTAAGWSSFDVGTKASTAKAYIGAVFDGRYVYFVPAVTTLVARFEARSTAGPIPYNGGSFF